MVNEIRVVNLTSNISFARIHAFHGWWLLRMVQTVVAIFNILSMSRLLVRVTNMQALARDQVRRYSEGHGFGKASGPHTIYLTLTLIALTWSEQLRYLTSSTNELFFKFVSFNHFENLTTVWTIRSSHHPFHAPKKKKKKTWLKKRSGAS